MTFTTRPRQRSMLVLATVVFGASATLLAACGGSSSSPGGASTAAASASPASGGSASSPATSASRSPAAGSAKTAVAAFDPCALLTQDEVDTAVGQPLGAGKRVATLDDCLWTTSDFVAGVDVTVSGWTEIKAAATGGKGKAPESISGVGDEALNLNGSGGSLLYVRKGSQGFLIVINGPHIDGAADHGLAQEKVLGLAIVRRLP